MSLYPTFEDLKVDGLVKAQNQVLNDAQHTNPEAYAAIATYMGLDLNNFHYNESGELVPGGALPPPLPTASIPAQQQVAVRPPDSSRTLATPTATPGEIKHGVRRIVLCKDAAGKVGVQLTNVDNVSYV